MFGACYPPAAGASSRTPGRPRYGLRRKRSRHGPGKPVASLQRLQAADRVFVDLLDLRGLYLQPGANGPGFLLGALLGGASAERESPGCLVCREDGTRRRHSPGRREGLRETAEGDAWPRAGCCTVRCEEGGCRGGADRREPPEGV